MAPAPTNCQTLYRLKSWWSVNSAFMQLQAEISRNRLQAKIGSVQQVLVDGADANGATARSFADAPEIDGQVYVVDGQHLRSGDRVNVKITDADEYDLSGILSENQ